MDDDAEGLDFHPHDILYAFDLAEKHYAKGRSHKDSLHNRWDVALGIFDRACMESDRGRRLLELTNEVERLTDELNTFRKGQGGTYIIGPFGI